jgi:cytochrome c556
MKTLIATTTALAALCWALPAAAQFQKPEDAVKYRRAAFTMLGTHFGRIGAMASGRAPYDAAAAQVNADLVVMLSTLPYAGFVEGTAGTDKGTAKASIWTERAKFDEAAKKMQDAVLKVQAAAKSNNLDTLKAAFGPAGGACKSCHDDFRNP